nr:transferrin [Onthophagus taurus]
MEMDKFKFTLIYLAFLSTTCTLVSAKYKICVVDGRGGFQKTSKYCPNLEVPESMVSCVTGVDRFDCLRKIRKGKADFAIFTPEDLVAAANTYNDVLITNEIRTSDKEKFEEQLVAIVSKSSGIESSYDLSGKTLCHPGYINDGIISTVLMDYFETSVVRPNCEQTVTVPENRINATSKFFKKACKPGPWVNDRELDNELKRKYKNLCEACNNPSSCSSHDQYYGTSGSLLCLRDGSGDIAWTTLNTAISQFGLNNIKDRNSTNDTTIYDYKFLCSDDTTRPLTATPCVWVAKPWAVIGASSSTASAVQKIVANVSHVGLQWQKSLMDLIEVVNYHTELGSLETVEPVESYLLKIPGFLSANSFTSCHPPRTVKICTTSIVSKYKCDWMREAAEVRGIAPDIDCLKADNVTHCMRAIQMDVADVVIVEPDYVQTGVEKYGLSTLFYETVQEENKVKIIAVVKSNSDIKTFKDLMGKKACFSMYNGMAWNSVLNELQHQLSYCPYEKAMSEYFGESCVPGIPPEYEGKLTKLCESKYQGDRGALDCLTEKNADVAFVSTKALNSYINETGKLTMSDLKIICDTKPCHLTWSPVGQAMVYNNLTSWRQKDILDVFLELDLLFGKNFKEATRVFTMYGPFNGVKDVLFHDDTKELRKVPVSKNYDAMPRRFDEIVKKIKSCKEVLSNGAIKVVGNVFLFLIGLFLVLS